MTMKRIVVTGGNKGIGKAICERLLKEYDDTFVLLGSRNLSRGQEAVTDILNNNKKAHDRLECIELDTSSKESIDRVAEKLSKEPELYGIINNAGVGWGYSVEETVKVNYFGPRNVNDAFGKFLKHGGRIVNVASASGPNFISSLPSDSPLKVKLAKPWTLEGSINDRIAAIDEIALKEASSIKSMNGNGYGFSKALLNAYTVLLARAHPEWIINSCTPGWIATDLTAGSNAPDPPSKGAIPPCYLMMDEVVAKQPTGRYYGSDSKRSPLDCYRAPGDAPYESNEDVEGFKSDTK